MRAPLKTAVASWAPSLNVITTKYRLRVKCRLLVSDIILGEQLLYLTIASSSHNRSFKAYENSTWIVETLLKDCDKRIRPGVKGE